jgi:hypothetical protein
MDKIIPVRLGVFKVRSAVLIVSDPCYGEMGTNLNAEVGPVLVGNWIAEAYTAECRDWGQRCFRLLAYHESAEKTIHQGRFKWHSNCAVDAGLMSVFDSADYHRDKSIPGNFLFSGQFAPRKPAKGTHAQELIVDGDRWWQWILFFADCESEGMRQDEGFALPSGAVTSSGYGDGVYPLCVHRRPRKALYDAVRVDFIPFEEVV